MAFLSKKARTSRRSPNKPLKGDLVTELGISEPIDKEPNWHLYIYRNPNFNSNKKETTILKHMHDWRPVDLNTTTHDATEMYEKGDLILYNGPTIHSSGRNKRICFIEGQIYAVEGSRFNKVSVETIRLVPSGDAHTGKSVPDVSTVHVRHISKNIEDERVEALHNNILLKQLTEVNTRFIGVPNHYYNQGSQTEYNRRIYVLHCFWYKSDYVRTVCETLGYDFSNPGSILCTESIIEALFSVLWEDDILAKVVDHLD